MLLTVDTLQAIVAGDIDLVFRRWFQPRVTAGRQIRTAIGELAIEAVDRVETRQITDGDARRAGFGSRADLVAALRRREGDTYRVRVRYVGADRRIALREDANLGTDDVAAIATKLDRADARAKDGPWTRRLLGLIAAHPGVVSTRLAGKVQMPRDLFKRRVRRLKELGLTISLEVGYELSPRGTAFLDARA